VSDGLALLFGSNGEWLRCTKTPVVTDAALRHSVASETLGKGDKECR